MKEDDAPNAGIHAVISSQQQLAVEAPVLLGVLSANGLQSLGNAPCREASHGNKGISLSTPTWGPPPTVFCPHRWTHLQPGCPCPEPRSGERCQRAPSSAPGSVLGVGGAWCLSVPGQETDQGGLVSRVSQQARPLAWRSGQRFPTSPAPQLAGLGALPVPSSPLHPTSLY